MVPRTGLEPVRLVGYATNTGGLAVPCVYQFHHLGKNNPPLLGAGFLLPLVYISPSEVFVRKLTFSQKKPAAPPPTGYNQS